MIVVDFSKLWNEYKKPVLTSIITGVVVGMVNRILEVSSQLGVYASQSFNGLTKESVAVPDGVALLILFSTVTFPLYLVYTHRTAIYKRIKHNVNMDDKLGGEEDG